MKTNTLKRILLLPNLLHELLHCLPAWFWGLSPSIDSGWSRMRHHRTTNTKTMIILLMPAFTGLLVFPFVYLMIEKQSPFYIAVMIFWVGWMLACGKDFYKAGHFLLFGKWHNREEV